MKDKRFDENGLAKENVHVKIYHWNSVTLKYSGFSTEVIPMGTGLPAYSCLDRPKECKTGYVVFRDVDRQVWYDVPDHTGKTAYFKQTGAQVIITSPGELNDNLTFAVPDCMFPKFDEELGRFVNDEAMQKEHDLSAAKERKASLMEQAAKELLPLDIAYQEGWAGKDVMNKRKNLRRYIWELSQYNPENYAMDPWPILET